MQMKSEQPADEIQFFRELFTAMIEVSAEKTDLTKILYPYDVQTAHIPDLRANAIGYTMLAKPQLRRINSDGVTASGNT